MFCNLRAEMARYGVSSTDMAKLTGKTDRSIRDKINGKYEFTLNESKAIRDKFFPGLSLEYLFAADTGQQGA